MLFYLIPILLSFLLAFFKFKGIPQQTTIFTNSFVFLVAVIFCGGYMTGSDWVNYELLYDKCSVSGLITYPHEKGFYVLMLLFKSIGISFFPFLIICKFWVFFSVTKYLQSQCRNFYLVFAIFIATDALFVYVDNPLRFMLALGIIVHAYKYLVNGKFFPYMLIVLFASFFHITSVIMLPIYFLKKIIIQNRILLILYFSLYFVLTPTLAILMIDQLFPFVVPFIRTYYERIGLLDFSFFSIGKVMYSFFFLLILKYKIVIVDYSSNGRYYFTFSIIFFFLTLIGNVIPTFFRLALLLSPFLYISLSIIFEQLKWRCLIKPLLLLYFVFSTVSRVDSTYVYVPYSNYFFYSTFEDLPYEYRIKFNKQKYYERTGVYPVSFFENTDD